MRSTGPADHVPRTVSKLLKLYDCECTVFNRPPCNRRQPSLMQSLRILIQKSARLFAPIHDNQSVRTWRRALVPVLFRTRLHLCIPTMVQRLPLPRAKAPGARINRHEVYLLLILISQFHLIFTYWGDVAPTEHAPMPSLPKVVHNQRKPQASSSGPSWRKAQQMQELL